MAEPDESPVLEKEEGQTSKVPTKKTITLEIIKTRNSRSIRRLEYLAKRLTTKLPPGSTEYFQTEANRILGMLKQMEDIFQLDELAQIEMAEFTKVFHDFQGKFFTEEEADGGQDEEEEDRGLRKVWKMETVEYFGELFEWMEDNFEFILQKFESQFYIEADAIDFVHQRARELVHGIFSQWEF